MNKSELVEQVAQRSGLSNKDAAAAVDAALDSVADALSRGSDVNLPGFGKFSVSERAARQGVNPATGEKIEIAATKVPKFAPSSKLKSAVKD